MLEPDKSQQWDEGWKVNIPSPERVNSSKPSSDLPVVLEEGEEVDAKDHMGNSDYDRERGDTIAGLSDYESTGTKGSVIV